MSHRPHVFKHLPLLLSAIFKSDVWHFLCLFIPSEDYAYNFVQWQIGVGSLWSEAIGLAPLKDRCLVGNNFGPSSVRATLKGYISLNACPAWGSHGRGRPRRYPKWTLPRLAFSCFVILQRKRAPRTPQTVNWPFWGRPWSPDKGPFVPGDRIGFENEHITAKAYNKDGLLLQMGDSMKPIDEIIKSKSGITGPNKFSPDNPRISDSRLVQILANSQLEILIYYPSLANDSDHRKVSFEQGGPETRSVSFKDHSWIHDFRKVFLEKFVICKKYFWPTVHKGCQGERHFRFEIKYFCDFESADNFEIQIWEIKRTKIIQKRRM